MATQLTPELKQAMKEREDNKRRMLYILTGLIVGGVLLSTQNRK